MSSAVLSASAATGRLFVFDDVPDPHGGTAAPGCPVERSSTACRQDILHSTINNHKILPSSIIPASRLEIRPAPEMVSSGVSAIDALTGGLPRGCLTEICGPASSGRTTVLLAALAAATRREEFCALVDASDALDPQSVAAAGVELGRLLWVRCGENPPPRELSPQRHPSTSLRAGSGTEKNLEGDRIQSRNPNQSERRLEQVLRVTDLLLESGGFGLIVLDLADLPPRAARRIPLTTWFRFRRAVEHTPTILLSIEQQPTAGSCSSLLLRLGPAESLQFSAVPPGLGPVFSRYPGLTPWAKECRRSAAEPDNAFNGTNAPQTNDPTHAHLLAGLNINAELNRSRLERKPACSVAFATKTAWAG